MNEKKCDHEGSYYAVMRSVKFIEDTTENPLSDIVNFIFRKTDFDDVKIADQDNVRSHCFLMMIKGADRWYIIKPLNTTQFRKRFTRKGFTK